MHLPKKRTAAVSLPLTTTFGGRCGLLSTVVILAIVAGCFIDVTRAVRAPNTTVINKCCRIGEELDKEQRCLVGGTEKWWPHIFLVFKRTYFLPRGESPRFFKIRERSVPACDQPELFTGNTNMAIFSNGSLYLLERNTFIEPDSYCVDRETALVCFPRPQGADSLTAPVAASTKVRKCCGIQSVYNKELENCVPLDFEHELFTKKLVMNSTAMIDFVFGFPTCVMRNHYAIVGKFKEEHFEATTGSLTLDSDKHLQSNEYCLEHTVTDMNSSYVNVFTCEEQFEITKSAAAQPDVSFEFIVGKKLFLSSFGK